MLDTNILIYLMKYKTPSIVSRLTALGEDEAVMSWVTFAELVKGAEGSRKKDHILDVIDDLVRIIPVDYTMGQNVCRHYGYHSNRLKQAGTPVGNNDLWIACHALSIHAILVTNNVPEFSRIEGLDVRNWV